MQQAGIKSREASAASLRLSETRRLLAISWQLSDMLEDALEEHRGYTKEFLQGLEKSLKNARAGKVVRINSLRDLA